MTGQPNRHAGEKLIATNKQARRLYEFLEVMEAGLVLMGSELKSLREGRVNFMDGYVRFNGGEAWLTGVHIAPYANAGMDPHEPRASASSCCTTARSPSSRPWPPRRA